MFVRRVVRSLASFPVSIRLLVGAASGGSVVTIAALSANNVALMFVLLILTAILVGIAQQTLP